MGYKNHEHISLKEEKDYDESWLCDRILEDPSILGLGTLVGIGEEKRQPGGGRLDFLFQDRNSNQRYAIEVQLGEVDESHIIRTIEYWDKERRGHPKYNYYAVLIAEKINNRFLNIISLFGGVIPIILIQVRALKVGNTTTLVFTTMLNEPARDEDDDTDNVLADRGYWVERFGKEIIKIIDQVIDVARGITSRGEKGLVPKYTKFYIGTILDNRVNNFIRFRPNKRSVTLELKLEQSKSVDVIIDKSSLDTLDYNGWYRVRVTQDDLDNRKSVIEDLIKIVCESRQIIS